ncbi:hypothetical protein EBZ39_06135 [bacterium]|nr:hypothetical protein [bacterium]
MVYQCFLAYLLLAATPLLAADPAYYTRLRTAPSPVRREWQQLGKIDEESEQQNGDAYDIPVEETPTAEAESTVCNQVLCCAGAVFHLITCCVFLDDEEEDTPIVRRRR